VRTATADIVVRIPGIVAQPGEEAAMGPGECRGKAVGPWLVRHGRAGVVRTASEQRPQVGPLGVGLGLKPIQPV
jgi:hypothetical protein